MITHAIAHHWTVSFTEYFLTSLQHVRTVQYECNIQSGQLGFGYLPEHYTVVRFYQK